MWNSSLLCVCIYIYIYMIEHNRYFLSTYFFVNPFKLTYWSYDIWWELVDKPSIISYFPSTFYPTLGHHQERRYYKSDVTFVCTTLSRRLTLHLSDTSSIAQHLKKHSCPTTELWKILTESTTISEQQNNN